MNTTMAPFDQMAEVSSDEQQPRQTPPLEMPMRRRQNKSLRGLGKRVFGFSARDSETVKNDGNSNINGIDANSRDRNVFGFLDENKGSTLPSNLEPVPQAPPPSAVAVNPALSANPSVLPTPSFTISLAATSGPSSLLAEQAAGPLSSSISDQLRGAVDSNEFTNSDSSGENTDFNANTASSLPGASSVASVVTSPAAAVESGTTTSNGGMSSLTERSLIAAGAIGAFLIVLAAFFFILRMNKRITFVSARTRRSENGVMRGWEGMRKGSTGSGSVPLVASKIPGRDAYSADEKSVPAQQQVNASFSPKAVPLVTLPAQTAALSRSDSHRQELVREALPRSPTTIQASSAPQPVNHSASMAPNTSASQRPQSVSHAAGSEENLLRRQLSESYQTTGNQTLRLPHQPSDFYQNTSPTNTYVTMSTNDAEYQNQRERNHMSYLSSLSSGFGDGLIIPEEPSERQSYAQPRAQRASRFSWATSGPRGERASVYTTASIDSTPRFRTVNSWVAHQSGQVERRHQNEKDLPRIPVMPAPLRIGVDHRRQKSDNSAFLQHPGEEIVYSPVSRISSSILDGNLVGK